MKGRTDAIATYNMLGGSLEGFAVPIGLLQLGSSQVGGSQVGSSHLSNLSTPDVTDVTAIPKGLYEKLMDLAKYDKHDKSDSKKQTKGRNKNNRNKKTRKQGNT